MDCIFCKIGSGEIPSKKVYENDGAFAFLDIEPLSDGHTLVIPKKHFVEAHEMDGEIWGHVADALEHASKMLVEKLGVKSYNILQNNGRIAHQKVMHVHFHIIPRTEDSGLVVTWGETGGDLEKVYDRLKQQVF